MTDPRPLTPDDLIHLQLITDAQISPDGATIAFTVGEIFKDKTKRPKSQVWIVSAESGEARPFTCGPRSDNQPRWSPDGQWLAFMSDRVEDGKQLLYLMPRGGGEAHLLTETKGAVSWVAWSPDGAEIALLMDDPETDEERQRKEDKDDAIEFEKNHKFTRVWIIDVASKAMRCVTTGAVQVWEASWSPDGQAFALIASAEPYEWSWFEAGVARVSSKGGDAVTLVNPLPRQVATPRWSPDGQWIAYLSASWSDRGSVGGDLYIMPTAGGAARNLTGSYRGSVRWMEWEPDSQALFVLATEDARAAFCTLALDGAMRPLWSAPVALAERFQSMFSRAADRLGVIREDLDHPRDVWVVDRRGDTLDWRQLTHFNPQVANWTLGTAEEWRWQSRDELDLQGILVRPVGYEPGRRYPLVTLVHGGPTSLYDFRFSAGLPSGLAQLLATRGYAVFLPNPRGSTGWGTAFSEANLGDMGGKDMLDIFDGIDDLVARGIADADRLAVAGWSYGGFMAAWMVTQTNRFKAAIIGAAITNWRSFHGASNLSTWDQQYLLADPYESGGAYDRFSPMRHITNVRTPALILHGEKDPYVPVGQGYEMFRALKELHVPVEMVVYPRESHGLMELAHRRDLLSRQVAWIEKHLG